MEILLLGRPSHERTRVQLMLEEAGLVPDPCHDGSWGCEGMQDACPLDGRTIDVAVAVAEPSDRFDPQGISCAYRARIPIVVVGATADDPVHQYASQSVELSDVAVVAATQRAAVDCSGHARVVEEALAPHLETGEHITVAARRRADGIAVTLTVEADPGRRAMLADRARAAVRAHDARTSIIDVSVTEP